MLKKIMQLFKSYYFYIVTIIIFVILLVTTHRTEIYKWQDLCGSMLTGTIAIIVIFIQRKIDKKNIQEQHRPLISVSNCLSGCIPHKFIYVCSDKEEVYVQKQLEKRNFSGFQFIKMKNVSKKDALFLDIKIRYNYQNSLNNVEETTIEKLEPGKEVYILKFQEKLYESYINTNSNYSGGSVSAIYIYLTTELNEKVCYSFLPQIKDSNKQAFYFKLEKIQSKQYNLKNKTNTLHRFIW